MKADSKGNSSLVRGSIAALAAGAVYVIAPSAHGQAVPANSLYDVQWNYETSHEGQAAGFAVMSGNAATGSTNVGAGSTALTTDIWNQLTTDDQTSPGVVGQNVTDVYGNSNGVSITVNGNNAQNNGNSGNFNSGTSNVALTDTIGSPGTSPYYLSNAVYSGASRTNNFNLFANQAATLSASAGGPKMTITISGLNPADTYDLWVYSGVTGNNGFNTINEAITAGANNVTGNFVKNGGGLPVNFVNTFIELTGITTDGSGNLVFTDAANAGSAGNPIEGFQFEAIAPVPEPASLGLLGLGSLALVARRRRK